MVIDTLQSKSDKEISESLSNLTPYKLLIESCRYGFLYGVKQSLDKGVDPSACNNDAIQWASQIGHVEIVELLLNDPRVDPSALNNWAIRYASKNGHKKVIELLLNDERVDPSVWDNYVIRQASANGHKEVVSLLLKDKRVKL